MYYAITYSKALYLIYSVLQNTILIRKKFQFRWNIYCIYRILAQKHSIPCLLVAELRTYNYVEAGFKKSKSREPLNNRSPGRYGLNIAFSVECVFSNKVPWAEFRTSLMASHHQSVGERKHRRSDFTMHENLVERGKTNLLLWLQN